MKEEKEIETKLDVPLQIDKEKIIAGIERLLVQQGWEVLGVRGEEKELLYYDTPTFSLYDEGSTLRRVMPFDPSKFPGSVRYDFKQGFGQNRTEVKYWTDKTLGGKEILQALDLIDDYSKIVSVAHVVITPRLWDIRKGNTALELKLDSCWIDGGVRFRELELELKEGDQSQVYGFCEVIAKKLGLTYRTQQKYSRVVEELGLLRGRLDEI